MIEIKYCVRWNYLPKAVRLAEQIKQEMDVEIALVSGDIGELSVYKDNKKISNKGDSLQLILQRLKETWKRLFLGGVVFSEQETN